MTLKYLYQLVFIIYSHSHNLKHLYLVIGIMNVLSSSVYLVNYCKTTCCNVIQFLSRHDIAVSHVLIRSVSWHMTHDNLRVSWHRDTPWRYHDTIRTKQTLFSIQQRTSVVYFTLSMQRYEGMREPSGAWLWDIVSSFRFHSLHSKHEMWLKTLHTCDGPQCRGVKTWLFVTAAARL